MLASLLPGFRDLRAPLVAGSMLLFSLALFFDSPLSPALDKPGRSSTLNELLDWIGRPGLVAAVLLVAYLVGALATMVTRRVISDWNFRSITLGSPQKRLAKLGSPFTEDSVRSAALEIDTTIHVRMHQIQLDKEEATAENKTKAVGILDAKESRVRGVMRDDTKIEVLRQTFRDGLRRLRLASPDLYVDADRSLSEAELRDSLLIPSPVLMVAVFLNTSLSSLTEAILFVVAGAVLVCLFVHARQLDRDGHSLVLGALSDHTISVFRIDPLDWDGRHTG